MLRPGVITAYENVDVLETHYCDVVGMRKIRPRLHRPNCVPSRAGVHGTNPTKYDVITPSDGGTNPASGIVKVGHTASVTLR